MTIIESAASIWGINPSDITSPSRTRDIADARMAVALMCRLMMWPDGATAKVINRTRSAANYSILTAKEALETNPKFRAKFNQLSQSQGVTKTCLDGIQASGKNTPAVV